MARMRLSEQNTSAGLWKVARPLNTIITGEKRAVTGRVLSSPDVHVPLEGTAVRMPRLGGQVRLRMTVGWRSAGLFLLLASFAPAQNITGTVTNGTTGKPSGGDDV